MLKEIEESMYIPSENNIYAFQHIENTCFSAKNTEDYQHKQNFHNQEKRLLHNTKNKTKIVDVGNWKKVCKWTANLQLFNFFKFHLRHHLLCPDQKREVTWIDEHNHLFKNDHNRSFYIEQEKLNFETTM